VSLGTVTPHLFHAAFYTACSRKLGPLVARTCLCYESWTFNATFSSS